jgi:hypothetical protein
VRVRELVSLRSAQAIVALISRIDDRGRNNHNQIGPLSLSGVRLERVPDNGDPGEPWYSIAGEGIAILQNAANDGCLTAPNGYIGGSAPR